MFASLFSFLRIVVGFIFVLALWGSGMWFSQLAQHPDTTFMEMIMFEFLTILPILCLLLLGFMAGMKKSPPSTPRSYVTCKDWNDYLDRIGRLRYDCRQRMDISESCRWNTYAGNYRVWYVNDVSISDRYDNPEFAIITKQKDWVRKQFHKTCKERGINHMKSEHLDNPHI